MNFLTYFIAQLFELFNTDDVALMDGYDFGQFCQDVSTKPVPTSAQSLQLEDQSQLSGRMAGFLEGEKSKDFVQQAGGAQDGIEPQEEGSVSRPIAKPTVLHSREATISKSLKTTLIVSCFEKLTLDKR